MKSVLILQRRLPQYRLQLFEFLKARLAEEQIELTLAVGEPTPEELARGDERALPWAIKIPTNYYRLGGKRAVWLALPHKLIAEQDLLIIPHENSFLNIFPLLLHRSRSGPLVAFWGHGANFQARTASDHNAWLRNWTARQADWWFAYTQRSVHKLLECDIPEARISCLNNAVDTTQLASWQAEIGSGERAALLAKLGLQGTAVGIALGSLHAHRRLPFLCAAADAIRRQLPAFELIVIGDGPERNVLQDWACQREWVRWIGALQGRDKVLYASLGHCLLNPGMVGLNILDGFALGLPLVTTDCGIHSPEIAYLEPGSNGILAPDTVSDFAGAVVRLLGDLGGRMLMTTACREAAQRYSLEAMIDNFTAGIRQALGEVPAAWPEPATPAKHVAIVWQRFLPYHAARVRRLHEVLAGKGIRLSTIEVASADASYVFAGAVADGAASWQTCFPGKNYNQLTAGVVGDKVLATLRLLQPDLVLAPATAFPEGMAALRYRLESGVRAVVMDDAWGFTDKRGWLTHFAKRMIHKNADAAFFPAPSHLPYYVRLGFPAERTLTGYDVVDNEWFAARADEAQALAFPLTRPAATLSPGERGNVSLFHGGEGAPLGADEGEHNPHFLFVGRFLPRKGVDTLLAAYAAYRAAVQTPWDLVLVGGGPEEAALKRQAQGVERVHFAGVRTGAELGRSYGRAAALVVPSESDPWALVVNEGLAASLPVLVSRGCGCARTLVAEGENGWTFSPGNVQELTECLAKISSLSEEQRTHMGVRSREIIDDWGLDRFADGVLQALQIPRRPPAGFLSNLAVRLWKGRVRVN